MSDHLEVTLLAEETENLYNMLEDGKSCNMGGKEGKKMKGKKNKARNKKEMKILQSVEDQKSELGKGDEILNRIEWHHLEVTFEHRLEAGEGVSHANI